MDDSVVMVTNMISAQVGLVIPDMRVKKVWPRKGAKMPIKKDLLREAIYDPGVEAMFKEGTLYIDDMDFKIELGLESEGTKTPTNIKAMDENFMDRLLRKMPLNEVRSALHDLSDDQRTEFLNYAVKQNDINLDRIEAINEVCHTNLLHNIQLNRQREEK